MSGLYDGVDMDRVLYGEKARRVPAWMYVQQQDNNGMVSFVGASNVDGLNPLRFGSERTHQFVLGEIIVRPRLVIATDSLRGMGLSALATGDHDFARMLADGEAIIGAPERARRTR